MKRHKTEEDILYLSPAKIIHCAGDSLTAGTGSTSLGTGFLRGYPYVLSTLITDGKTVFNGGTDGEKIEGIAMRQGGILMFCKPFTLPADKTSVEITLYCDNGDDPLKFPDRGGQGLNPVSINGIQGSITHNAEKNYFTRSQVGQEIILPRDTVIETNGSNYKGGILTIFAGSNNKVNTTTIKDYFQYFDNMIAYNGNDKYIIIGLTSLNYMSEVAEVNKLLSKQYGFHFLDIRRYLLNYGLQDAGITPTTADNQAIRTGEMPPSLLVDEIHFNDAGYRIIGQQLYRKGKELKFWS